MKLEKESNAGGENKEYNKKIQLLDLVGDYFSKYVKWKHLFLDDQWRPPPQSCLREQQGSDSNWWVEGRNKKFQDFDIKGLYKKIISSHESKTRVYKLSNEAADQFNEIDGNLKDWTDEG